MLRTTLISATLLFTSSTYAVCEPDTMEIGDTGPASQLVCKTMEARYPEAEVKIIDREIHSANSVSVIATVDGRTQSLTYQLVGADWSLTDPVLAKND